MINVNAFMFLLMFAISQATSIVAANAYGKKDFPALVHVLKASYLIYVVAMVTIQIMINAFPDLIFSIFTNNPKIIEIINTIFIYFVIDIFIDTLSLNIIAILNGRGDVKASSINQIISLLGVRVMAAYYLTFNLGMGLKGLVIGLACGGLSSLIFNGARFIYLTKQDKKIATL